MSCSGAIGYSTMSAHSSSRLLGGGSKAKLKADDPMSCRWQRLMILVFRGDPIDAPQFRHTALFIEDLDPEGVSTQHCLLGVVGSAGFFEREEDAVRDPRADTPNFAGSVAVATYPVPSASDKRMRDAIWSTAINNGEYSWNCQNWVGDALNSCIGAGLILGDEADWAIDAMADLILEAPDEVL